MPNSPTSRPRISRRTALGGGLAVAALAALPSPAEAHGKRPGPGRPSRPNWSWA